MKIKIVDFLKLTTNKKKLLKVVSDMAEFMPYDPKAEFCLGFCFETNRVIYHDGRHRLLNRLLLGEREVEVNVYCHYEKDFFPEGIEGLSTHYEQVFGKRYPVEDVSSLISQFDKEEVCL